MNTAAGLTGEIGSSLAPEDIILRPTDIKSKSETCLSLENKSIIVILAVKKQASICECKNV